MPEAAVIGWILFGVVCVGWRFRHQIKTTGDHGLRGLSRSQGVVGWSASGLLVGSFTASALVPVLEVFGILERTSAPLAQVVPGLTTMVLGLVITSAGQVQMGASWRVGVRSGEHTTLVQHGLFALVRNPIYSGVVASAVGAALIVPRPAMLIAALGAVLGVEIQVRAVEEPHLISIHGDDYSRYARHVGRFVPGFGIIDSGGGGQDESA